jgi:hypothetical protein
MLEERRLPSWLDDGLGTRDRAGLWLVEVVGEGNIFTKTQLRDAFPEVAQIDRRMRDLRAFGWKIDTNRQDISLKANEQRFVTRGADVWVPGKAVRTDTDVLTATQRRDIMGRDGHMCRSCGIASGDTYAGTYETAQLDIARRTVRHADGQENVELVTECNRCRVGGRTLKADLVQVLDDIHGLSRLETKILAGWVADDNRNFSVIEQLWAHYRALPEDSRAEVRTALDC